MNDLQKVIIKSIVGKNNTWQGFYNDILNTFPINTLCELLAIDRNRYNYLKRHDEQTLKILILNMGVKVAKEKDND